MGGCLFDNVTKEMRIYKEEIFGPVLSVVRARDYSEALALPSDHDYGNGVAIFTRDGDAARDFAAKVNVGMVGINVPIPVPIAYYTFGGWKKSGFGDLNQHGPDSIRFYTKTKTVTARWPSGVKEGAKLAVDGRSFKMQGYENGFYMGGCLFDNVTPEMKIYKDEIFGPVLSVDRAKDYAEGLKLVNDHEYGNGVAIYTRDGDTARDFAAKCKIGMVAINVPIPVPLAYHTFGGWKRSGFGDLNQHGPDSIRFYTRTKTVTSRWPSGIKEGSEFSIPTMS